MQKLYQRLLNWARFFGSEARPSLSRTIHTEVTVERQGVTVLMDGIPVTDFGTCPICGQKLGHSLLEQPRRRLHENSSSQEDLPDGTSS